MLYRGALYSNLHTYDFGDAAPSVDNSPGHWRRYLRPPFVREREALNLFSSNRIVIPTQIDIVILKFDSTRN